MERDADAFGFDVVVEENLKASPVVGIVLSVEDALDAMGNKVESTRTTGSGGHGNKLHFATLGKAAEVSLGMDNEFATVLIVLPESRFGFGTRDQAVVGCSDDAVLCIEGDSADFAFGIFRTEGCDVGQGHCVFFDAQFITHDSG
jgi:hypothetical protein